MRSTSNNQIKLLRKLAQKKYRDKEGLFIVEGERAVEQVLENGIVSVKEVFLEKGKIHNLQQSNNNLFELDPKQLGEITNTENSQGILAVCEIPKQSSAENLDGHKGLIVAADRIQDPGNLGTIVRTAVWFGASGLLTGKGSADLFHPKVVRSTAGATGILPYMNAELEHDLDWFENNGWQVLLLDGNDGARPIKETQPKEKIVLVTGNEANGINRKLITSKRERILIPRSGNQPHVESLNAAIALSIALYQLKV